MRRFVKLNTPLSNYFHSSYRRFCNAIVESTTHSSGNVTQKKLSIALLGKPNVGKSTLFNRLCGSNMAIVSSVPGTTRDRQTGEGTIAGISLLVTDTGGLDDRGAVHVHIQQQAEKALATADVVIFMLDAKAGITAIDEDFAKWLRKRIGKMKSDVEVVLVANKTEGAHLSNRMIECVSDGLRLGLGEPLLISASHGDGLSELTSKLVEIADRKGLAPIDEDLLRSKDPLSLLNRTIQVAIMGKPNVGKSSVVNAILGEDRAIAGPTPGLTRDALYVEWFAFGRHFRLVDTAGLTRVTPNRKLLSSEVDVKNSKLYNSFGAERVALPGSQILEKDDDPSQFSLQVSELALRSTLRALKYAQVVLLMVEGSQGKFSAVDLQIARKTLLEGRAVVVVANKRDLVAKSGLSHAQYEEGVREHCKHYLREFGDVPVVSVSATLADGLDRLLQTIIKTHDDWSRHIPTWVLNEWLNDLLVINPPVRANGKAVKIRYIAQVRVRPPTFALFCNQSTIIPTYIRFLRNRMQSDFKFSGVPLRFLVRKTVGTRVQRHLLVKQTKHRRHIGKNYAKPAGPKRHDFYAEMKRKTARDESRRRMSRLKRRFRKAGRHRARYNVAKPFVRRH